MLACREREAMVMAPPPTRDSAASACFHDCPAFLNKHFPPQSPPWHPLDPSLHSQQQPLPWDCSTIPKLQLPAPRCTFQGTCVRGRYGYNKEPYMRQGASFHLGCHRSVVSLSALNVSPLTQTIPLMWGSDPYFSSPSRCGQVQSY